MKSVLLKEIEERCEKTEDMVRASLTLWQLLLISFHLYLAFDNVSMELGATIYCYVEILILSCQLIFRHLKLLNRTGRYRLLQKLFCVFHFCNFILLCFVFFDVEHFRIENLFAVRLTQLLCLLGAFYYLSIFVCFFIIWWRVTQRSKTGIQNATLVVYETARMEKWIKAYYPQQNNNVAIDEEECSDVSKSSSEDNSDCPICLDKFDSAGMVCRLNCKHYYHLDCIYKWLQHQNSRKVCPLCKNINQLEV